MSGKNEKFEKEIDALIKQLQDDYQSTIPPEQRKYRGVPAESLIWNLFCGKNYNFSYRIFKEVMKRLKNDIGTQEIMDC